MSERILGTYQMLWDCPACGKAELLAVDQRCCPGCGSPQDPRRRYYPSAEKKVRLHGHQFVGADKACSACSTPNVATNACCVSCGAPLAAARSVAVRANQVAGKAGFIKDSAKAAEQELGDGRSAARPPIKRSFTELWRAVFMAVVFGGMMVALVVQSWTTNVDLTVKERTWQRIVPIETYKMVEVGDWRDQVPAGAKIQSCSQLERSSNQVPDGQSCNMERRDRGDGSYNEVEVCSQRYRSEPVYDTYCNYLTPAWVTTDTRKLSGNGKTIPEWPQVFLTSEGTCLGCERLGERKQVYEVIFQGDDEDTHSCEVTGQRWTAYREGSTWRAEMRVLTDGLLCDTLVRAR